MVVYWHTEEHVAFQEYSGTVILHFVMLTPFYWDVEHKHKREHNCELEEKTFF